MITERTMRATWRWYWVLLIANALDLLFTYTAAERGVAEANVLLEPILLTPWPAVLKFTALAMLALGLIRIADAGRRPSRVLSAVRSVAYLYVVLLLFHLIGLYLIG